MWMLALSLGLSGCASPSAVHKLDPAMLPTFPAYEWEPIEIPCGTERCLVIHKSDQIAIIKWMKGACYVLTNDREYCQLGPAPVSEYRGYMVPTGGHP